MSTERKDSSPSPETEQRLTFCYAGHYTRLPTRKHRGRHYCLPHSTALGAKHAANKAKEKTQ